MVYTKAAGEPKLLKQNDVVTVCVHVDVWMKIIHHYVSKCVDNIYLYQS